ncbi:putative methyl-CpG-binding domain protein 3-like 5 [Ctenodactylus gundi]
MRQPAGARLPEPPSVGTLRRRLIPENWPRTWRVRAPPGRRKAGADPPLSRRLTSCIFRRPVTVVTSRPGGRAGPRPREPPQEPRARPAGWAASGGIAPWGPAGLRAAPGPSPHRGTPIPDAFRPLLAAGRRVTAQDIQRQRQRVREARARLAAALAADRRATEAERAGRP